MRNLIRILLGNLFFFFLPHFAQAQVLTTQMGTEPSPTKNFEGLSLQIDIGYQPYIIKGYGIRINNTNIKLADQNYSGNSTPYFAGMSYTIPINDRVLIGAQIEINPINQQYVLSLLPGYAFTSDIQGYLKLAWVNALVSINLDMNQNKIRTTVNGATVGLGIKKLLDQNWYGFLETNYVKMNTFQFDTMLNRIPVGGNAEYSGYNIMVGVGYKF